MEVTVHVTPVGCPTGLVPSEGSQAASQKVAKQKEMNVCPRGQAHENPHSTSVTVRMEKAPEKFFPGRVPGSLCHLNNTVL